MINNWPSWLNLTPPQTNQYEAARREYYHRRERRVARSHYRWHRKSASIAENRHKTTVESPPPSSTTATVSNPAPASAPPANLTLAGDNQDRDRARQLLQSVDSRLVQLNSHKLSGTDIKAYHRANELALRARHALAERDYAAASSLAAKASSLANGIGSSGL